MCSQDYTERAPHVLVCSTMTGVIVCTTIISFAYFLVLHCFDFFDNMAMFLGSHRGKKLSQKTQLFEFCTLLRGVIHYSMYSWKLPKCLLKHLHSKCPSNAIYFVPLIFSKTFDYTHIPPMTPPPKG